MDRGWPKGQERPKRPIMERFEEKCVPEPMSGCWIWLGRAHKTHGYGIFSQWPKLGYAHRFSWTLHYGEIPKGLCVLHKCDVPLCVNPNHLFLGTVKDNMLDMARKGRQRKGTLYCRNGHLKDYARRCQQCSRLHNREYMRQKRASA